MTFNKTRKKILATIMLVAILSCSFLVYSSAATDDFQATLDLFPESYHSYLIELHEQYPLWEFEPMYTGLDWDESVAAQQASNKALVTNSSGYSDLFKSTESDDYNSSTDTYIEHDSGFVAANEVAVSYYLDPRNFLTVEYIFQFEDLSFNDSFSVDDVELVLTGSYMSNTIVTYYDTSGKKITTTDTYAELIYEAGKTYDINPCYLASKILNEVGTTGSGSVSGTYSGYEGYYNFYNIGAYDGTDAIANGLSWASSGSTYGRPWTSPEASIFGGAEYIAENYIAKGQYTGYLQRFNVNPDSYYTTHTHQYMTNISGAVSQGYTNYLSYLASGSLDEKYVFSIPVYENMSAETSGEGDITLTDSATQTATINVSSSNVRTGPSTANSTLGITLSYGTEVQIIDQVFTDTTYYLNVLKYPYWAQIKFTVGSTTYTGYVPMDFLDVTSYTSVTTGTKTLSVTTSSSDVNVSFYSSDTSIAQVNSDNTITFLQEGDVTIVAYDSLQKYASCVYKVTGDMVSGVTTKSTTYDSITLSWNAIDGAAGYRVYQLIDGTYTSVITLSGSSTNSYTIENLDANTEYSFKVKSYIRDSSGTAVWGVASSAYTTSTKTAQVTMSSYSNSYESVTVKWNSLSGVDGYRVYMLVNGSWVTQATLSSSSTSYTVSGLDANTSYSFKVKAYVRNSSGTAIWLDASNEYVTATKTSQVEMTTYSNTYDAIRINWEATSIADGYRIYQYINGSWVTLATVDSSTLTYRISGLSSDTTYSFKVKAFVRNSSGTAIWLDASDEYKASTKGMTVKMTTYSSVYDAIRINWDSVDGADGYRVYMYVNGSWVSQATVSSSTLTYRMENLDANTEYSFKVKAYTRNSDGSVTWYNASDEYKASTKTSQVTMSSYSCTSDAIRVNWNSISGVDGYRVYMLVNGVWVNQGTVTSSTTTLRISGLSSNTSYQFKVIAFVRNSSGTAIWLDYSDIYNTKTK